MGAWLGEAQLHIVKKQTAQAKLFQPFPSSENKLTTISMYHVQNGKNEMNNKMEFVLKTATNHHANVPKVATDPPPHATEQQMCARLSSCTLYVVQTG